MKTKVCKTCGVEKPVAGFLESSKYVGGYRHHCNKCEYVKKAAARERARIRDIERVRLEAIARGTREEREKAHIAAPRTFHHIENYVPDAPGYIRNDGNRDIPSRGFI